MPKIFLIKNRLHQQQLRLLESQNLLHAKEDDRLGGLSTTSNDHLQNRPSSDSSSTEQPLSLTARKRDKNEGKQNCNNIQFRTQRAIKANGVWNERVALF